MAESRKEREVVLSDYRKQADEKKEFAEKVERRVRLLLLHNYSVTITCLCLVDCDYNEFLITSAVETCINYSLYCSV